MSEVENVTAEEYIANWIDSQWWPSIQSAVFLAYKAVNLMDLEWLVPFSGDVQALAYHCGVQATLFNYVQSGILPGQVDIRPNVSGTAYHLEWRTNDAILTSNQVHYYRALPRQADFRRILSGINQGRNALFQPDLFGERLIDALHKNCYVILTHGYRNNEPAFIGLGIPDESLQDWYHIIDLMKIVPVSQVDFEPHDIPPEEIVDDIKLQLRKWQHEALQSDGGED